MKVSAQYAEEHFADLLTAADSGEACELHEMRMRGDEEEPGRFLYPCP
jgi:hypothetical protein